MTDAITAAYQNYPALLDDPRQQALMAQLPQGK